MKSQMNPIGRTYFVPEGKAITARNFHAGAHLPNTSPVKKHLLSAGILGCSLLLASFDLRASGQNYALNWNVIANGGGTVASGPYGLSGTIGQAVAGSATAGGAYTLGGGFWSLDQTGAGVAGPAGLVGWWPANGNAVDVIGGNNGTLENSVTYLPGEVQQAFNFSANSAMVVLSNSPSLQLQDFTIEAWIKRGNATNATSDPTPAGEGSAILFGYGNNGYAFGVGSLTGNNELFLSKVGVGEVLSSAPVGDTNWHHVAVTTAGGNVVFYIDGVAYPYGNYNPGYTFATVPAIGGKASNLNQPNNNSFFGSIDELAVYSRALTAAEIQSIYQAGPAGKFIPPLPAGTLLSDHFDGNSLASSWTLERGNALVTNGWVTTYGDSGNSRDACIEAGDNTWSNYVLTTSFYAQANPEPPYNAPYFASYIWVRNQQQTGWGQGTYYCFTIVPPAGTVYGNSQVQFTKNVNSVQAFQTPWTSVAGIVSAGTNSVQVSALGGEFTLWLNGTRVFSYMDTNPIVTGGIALGGIWEGKVSYDSVQVVSVPVIGVSGVSLAGNNLTITGSNAFAGLAGVVLMTTNLTLPRSQWMPVATNVWSTGGNFSLTVSNVVNPFTPREFFSLDQQ